MIRFGTTSSGPSDREVTADRWVVVGGGSRGLGTRALETTGVSDYLVRTALIRSDLDQFPKMIFDGNDWPQLDSDHEGEKSGDSPHSLWK